MTQTNNPAILKRLDHASVVKFLSSAASVLVDAGSLGSQEADNLRINLTSLQLDEQASQSVLAQLEQQNAEFISILQARYGNVNLCKNLFRFTTINSIQQTISCLSELGENLLEKAPLFFNRPFFIYLGGECEHQTLFASVIIDLAEAAHSCSHRLSEVITKLSVLEPHHLVYAKTQDESIDLALAAEFEFSLADRNTTLPYVIENDARNSISASLRSLVDTFQESIEQIRYNTTKDETSKLSIICDSLSSEIQGIGSFSFPKTDDLQTWEFRRCNFISSIFELNQSLKNLDNEFSQTIAKSSSFSGASKSPVSQNIIRSMSSTMIREGTPALKATAAACALVKYCEQAGVPAKEILPGELHKIDPNLSLSSLELFQNILEKNNFAQHASEEKQRNLKRKNELLELFHKKLDQLGVLLPTLLLFLLASCGVKVAPKSHLIDYRPAVDHHEKRAIPDYMKSKTQEKPAAEKAPAAPNKKDNLNEQLTEP